MVQRLKDHGYKWSFWYNIGDPDETIDVAIKCLTADWTGLERVNSEPLRDWNYSVDTIILNWPKDFCSKIKEKMSDLAETSN